MEKKTKQNPKNRDVNILISTARGPSVLRFYDAGFFSVGPVMGCGIEFGVIFSSWPRVTGQGSFHE